MSSHWGLLVLHFYLSRCPCCSPEPFPVLQAWHQYTEVTQEESLECCFQFQGLKPENVSLPDRPGFVRWVWKTPQSFHLVLNIALLTIAHHTWHVTIISFKNFSLSMFLSFSTTDWWATLLPASWALDATKQRHGWDEGGHIALEGFWGRHWLTATVGHSAGLQKDVNTHIP